MNPAAAGMLSAAVLIAPACSRQDVQEPPPEAPLRRASYRSHVARAFLGTCPGAERRPETIAQDRRFEELRRLAASKDADHAIWLGANDWAAVKDYSRRTCGADGTDYRGALAEYGRRLDQLAKEIAAYR